MGMSFGLGMTFGRTSLGGHTGGGCTAEPCQNLPPAAQGTGPSQAAHGRVRSVSCCGVGAS
jgi:hypothetical protein